MLWVIASGESDVSIKLRITASDVGDVVVTFLGLAGGGGDCASIAVDFAEPDFVIDFAELDFGSDFCEVDFCNEFTISAVSTVGGLSGVAGSTATIDGPWVTPW